MPHPHINNLRDPHPSCEYSHALHSAVITSPSPYTFHDRVPLPQNHGSHRSSRRALLTSFRCLGSSEEEVSSHIPSLASPLGGGVHRMTRQRASPCADHVASFGDARGTTRPVVSPTLPGR